MRKFGLITANGKEIDLTSKEIFFHEPDGLGYEEEASYRMIGKEWSLLNKYQKQGQITGLLAFIGKDPYSQFRKFIRDTYTSTSNLVLTYTTDDGNTIYKRNVIITSIKKTEYNLCAFLDCDITFTALTPWYTELTLVTVPSNINSNDGWVWDVHSNWRGEVGYIPFRSTANMKVVANLNSNIPSPCALYIDGPIENPKWEHKVGSKVYATGAIDYDIPENTHVVIDNRTHPYSISLYNQDYSHIIYNLYKRSDFTTERFITLRKGKNTIRVYSESTLSSGAVSIRMEANIYHAAV